MRTVPSVSSAAAPPTADPSTVALATRVQRRQDFVAHLTGFAAGAVTLAAAGLAMPSLRPGAVAAALAWATALSFQHFRHVLRGPVTPGDVIAEHNRLGGSY